jgi:glyoxylase-like metal-dependent hydrolase (beta-lactamase superfamily II)
MRALAVLVLLLAAPALACEMVNYKRVKASEHVVVFEAAEGTTAVVNGNIVAIMGRDATLVVDTGQIRSTARRVIAELREMKAPPVRWVVNTHWHGDHLLGNSVFRDAYPGVHFIAHSHTIEQGARVYANYATRMAEQLPKIVEDMKKRGAETKSADEREWIAKTLDCVEKVKGEIPETVYLAPDTVEDHERTIDLGGLAVQVKHLGTGNTPGDLVVWVAADRVMASGDMVVAPVPYAIGSELDPWVKTLEALQKYDARVLVPGHGPVMRDARYLADVKALIAGTRTQVAELKARGVAQEEAARQIDTADFRKRYIDTPMRRQAFEEFYVKAVVRKAWAEAKPPAPARDAKP